jgi:hypothetical protein
VCVREQQGMSAGQFCPSLQVGADEPALTTAVHATTATTEKETHRVMMMIDSNSHSPETRTTHENDENDRKGGQDKARVEAEKRGGGPLMIRQYDFALGWKQASVAKRVLRKGEEAGQGSQSR